MTTYRARYLMTGAGILEDAVFRVEDGHEADQYRVLYGRLRPFHVLFLRGVWLARVGGVQSARGYFLGRG